MGHLCEGTKMTTCCTRASYLDRYANKLREGEREMGAALFSFPSLFLPLPLLHSCSSSPSKVPSTPSSTGSPSPMYSSSDIKRRNPVPSSTRLEGELPPRHDSLDGFRQADPYAPNPLKPAFQQHPFQQQQHSQGHHPQHRDHGPYRAPERKVYSSNKVIMTVTISDPLAFARPAPPPRPPRALPLPQSCTDRLKESF